ncbi:recombinase family protein [Nocardia speluncae]|uniref:Recombinase family protein n=1 Tax=Nocardia speluncae TaxID=419477 RepID=A0A846XAL6_9NOCA|nr:recombinase family protein [Nocardia speluncae]
MAELVYTRVSTDEQSTQRQIHLLTEAGLVDGAPGVRLFADPATSSKIPALDRDSVHQLAQYARGGDRLTVSELYGKCAADRGLQSARHGAAARPPGAAGRRRNSRTEHLGRRPQGIPDLPRPPQPAGPILTRFPERENRPTTSNLLFFAEPRHPELFRKTFHHRNTAAGRVQPWSQVFRVGYVRCSRQCGPGAVPRSLDMRAGRSLTHHDALDTCPCQSPSLVTALSARGSAVLM